MELNKKEWQELFGENLREVMNYLGFSSKQLSRSTGIGNTSIWNYINGRYTPSITSVIAMAQSLGVDYMVLLQPEYRTIETRYDFYDMPIGEYDWIGDFAFNLRSLMRRERYTQSELAEATGISQGLISKYMQGESIPSAYAVVKIIEYLKLIDDYDYLLDLGLVMINRRY